MPLQAVEGFSLLPLSEEAEKLSEEYLRFLRIPESDALHNAIATVEGMNYLITWNMQYLAREKTRYA
ncbi:MAG: hypothetical protein A2Y62_00900 [Candidatus Fischerbacteria bacterium RBG_13_37_8]|uniref:PIN domain-containing protein n=1 Tax=Candidatus Fischerbacteria bacterium RBG_13_37_8 TaxID=1817863 RepID=A0A1F5VKY4_9BACT|nr:MAG: hypothetical protein A2Y62_00900 [Candidatus Fischerbacteria bacterium RBG_13_37_8]